MFILRDILASLQNDFSNTRLGRQRAQWFGYILLAFIIPFTSSISSNILRCVTTIFGIRLNRRRFYTFMQSKMIPWRKLWIRVWNLIPEPATDGRLVLAVDDCLNPKTGKKIFGCARFFDHAAKANESTYKWAQNIVALGLLKRIKGRWACLPLAHRFYLSQKELDRKSINVNIPGRPTFFQTKIQQAVEMVVEVARHFVDAPVLLVCDSWFGNDGLFRPLRESLGVRFNLASRLRSNTVLYSLPSTNGAKRQRGRPRKYGERLGSCAEMAAEMQSEASRRRVFLYGRRRDVTVSTKVVTLKTLKCAVRVVWVYRKTQWIAIFSTDLNLRAEEIIEYYGARWKIESGFKEIKQDIGSSKSQTRTAHAVMNHWNFSMMATTITWVYGARLQKVPERRHQVRGRNSFAFSDIRRIIAEAALTDDFAAVCGKHDKLLRKSFVETLLRLIA